MNRKKADRPESERLQGTAPERREILDLLEDQGRPLKRREIVDRLNVTAEVSQEILRRRLKAMVRDGQLVKNRRGAYGLPARMDLVSGRVSAHPDGYGFVIPDSGDSDLYLSPRQMRSVLHGDRVLASVIALDSRGRREGAVTEILERAHSRVVGRFVEESGIALIVPDDPRINHDILVPLGCRLARPAGRGPGRSSSWSSCSSPVSASRRWGAWSRFSARAVRPAWPPRLPCATSRFHGSGRKAWSSRPKPSARRSPRR